MNMIMHSSILFVTPASFALESQVHLSSNPSHIFDVFLLLRNRGWSSTSQSGRWLHVFRRSLQTLQPRWHWIMRVASAANELRNHDEVCQQSCSSRSVCLNIHAHPTQPCSKITWIDFVNRFCGFDCACIQLVVKKINSLKSELTFDPWFLTIFVATGLLEHF